MKKKLIAILGMTLFILSTLLGFALNTVTIYADLEGSAFWEIADVASFDSTIETDGRLGRLQCPVVMGIQESHTVTLRVKNPRDYPINPLVAATFSLPNQLEVAREEQELQLAPHEAVKISWQVNNSNLLYRRFIFVRVFLQQSKYHPPSITRHCGILMVNFGKLDGNQIIGLVSGISLVGMTAGILLWRTFSVSRTRRDIRGFGVMAWLTGITGLNILANLAGWMVIAGLLLILTLLMFVAIFENVFGYKG
jgi:hypothetical protein